MKKEFLELISILLGDSSGHILSKKEELNSIIDNFNRVLQLRSDRVRFHSELRETMLSPVPIISNGSKIDTITLGINPSLLLDKNHQIEEKNKAGKTWDEYSNFYNSGAILENIDFASGRGFYNGVVRIVASFQEKRFMSWEDIKGSSKAQNAGINKNCMMYLNNYCGAEFIPFHSPEFKSFKRSKLNELFTDIPPYKRYILRLFEVIDESLSENGTVICNGANPSQGFLDLCNELSLKSLHLLKNYKNESAYSFYKWGNRNVILCHHQVRARGKLNSEAQIKAMVEDALQTFGLV